MRAVIPLVPVLALCACGGAGEPAPLERGAQPAADPARDLAGASRADAERALEERLDRLRESLDELRGDAARAGDEAWREVEGDLRRELGEAEQLLAELRRSGEESWRALRDDAAVEIRRLADRVADAVAGR